MTTPREPARFGRRALLKAFLAAGVGGVAGIGAYGYLYERRHLEVTHAAVPASGLPEALSGLRIGLMTDFHHSMTVPGEDIEVAVRLMQQEQPDLIMLGGDYVTWRDLRYVENAARVLAPLSAPHGVYAILGNHDDEREMPAALRAVGFEVLADARTRLTIAGEALDLVGLRFWTQKASDLVRLLSATTAPVLLLAHDPRRIVEAAALNVPVVLSGHTHGGQIILPGIGAIAARKFPIPSGLLRRENTTLFVSRGVGTVYIPFRLNCPPEIAVLTLQRQSEI